MALPPCSSSLNYDVFLNFRGSDTRHGFTGHLYKALIDKGIFTFIDDEQLQRGEEITPALRQAINESRIAITVLSVNYASSSFCLDELATILDCAQTKGMLVLPVFYNIDPSDVRHQKGSYEEALAKHEKRFKHMLQKWKMALHQVANLSGYHFKDGDGYEYQFIEMIVEQVSNEIIPARLHVADYPVGLGPLGSQVVKVRKLVDVRSDDDVHMIGIYGMGGIGKTTLALAVYNLIVDHFDGKCFLEKMREKANKYGLENVQSIVLSDLLGEKKIMLTSMQQGISMMQHRLRQKKVLLILDDVDKPEQLQAIAGGLDWFGPGSRVIITTRNKQLLTSNGVKRTYEVKELNQNDALQLLTWKAFKKENVDPSYKELLNSVVKYASGLPLALEVIGSNLFRKSIEEWKSVINRYERIPNDQILKTLKVSFDALEEDEKNVFLDIACCFKSYKLADVEDILRAHYGHCMKYQIGVLVEKSLIKLGRDGTATLHDLIEDMGKEIVRQESPKEPGKRSRLWLPEDIIQVLEDCTRFVNLRVLNVDGCQWLTEIPDISGLFNLEELSFKFCLNLISVHNSIGFLDTLKILNATWCGKLSSFPPLKLTSLEELDLSFCYRLENFPEILVKMEKIRRLYFNCTPIMDISTGKVLSRLVYLVMRKYGIGRPVMLHQLTPLDTWVCLDRQWIKLESEEKVRSTFARRCKLNDNFFSIAFMRFAHMERLDLSYNNFTILPECMKEFQCLEMLDVSFCNHLREIRGIPPNLKIFHAINCESLTCSSTSMLLNQELHGAGKTCFSFTGASIPEWLDPQSRGPSTSFWFRNRFPYNVLLFLIGPVWDKKCGYPPKPRVLINGRTLTSSYATGTVQIKTDHTYLIDLELISDKNRVKALSLENEWNHVEVIFMTLETETIIKASGIHVFRQESSMEDIRFNNPCRKRKLDNDLNNFESQNPC
ncbi:hypothetical protein Fmac_011552 [Flemingia macrophylla]|uniref:TIR domain-containing protein n=1 Tax=Flemingia macrophylla TaxID=520843 RepID=A0ABD1MMS9_9FABA